MWDREMAKRPVPGGRFPRIEDAQREARSGEEMRVEAAEFRERMRELDESETGV